MILWPTIHDNDSIQAYTARVTWKLHRISRLVCFFFQRVFLITIIKEIDECDQANLGNREAPQVLTFLSGISMPFYLLHQQVPMVMMVAIMIMITMISSTKHMQSYISCKIAMVAFVAFSRFFLMCPQINCLDGYKVTSDAFVWFLSGWLHLFSFSPVWVFKFILKSPTLLSTSGNKADEKNYSDINNDDYVDNLW